MGQGKDRAQLRQGGPRFSASWKARVAVGAALAAALIATVCGQTTAPSSDDQFDRAKSWKELTAQVDFGPRKPGTAAHRACRDYIMGLMNQTCENVRLQPFTHVWSRTGETIPMWNIIGEQNWANAKVRVMLLAHWDSRPSADQEQDPAKQAMPIPGADDGASGVAVLLELSRALKVSPAKVGVMYVMVDGEDLGPGEDEMYLGTEVLAKDLPSPRPDYGILLDMIGNRGVVVPKEPNSEKYAPKLEDSLYAFAAKLGLKDTFPNTEGPAIDDDHLPMNQAGVPTIDLIDFMGYQPYWHTLSDTVDKCSPVSLERIGRLLQEWLRQDPPFKNAG